MPTDLPNLLTLSRIGAIPVLVLLVALRSPASDLAACVLFSAAAITDYFDGRIARGRRMISDFGRMPEMSEETLARVAIHAALRDASRRADELVCQSLPRGRIPQPPGQPETR